MMFLSWAVKCFLWTSMLHSSYQVIQENFSPMSFPRSCACPDKDGKLYNLEPLRSKDKKHPRFSVNGTKYKGYSYNYNPCSEFHLGPKDSGCQGNVAICWWVLSLPQSADTYKTIGIQKGAKCDYDDDQDKTPVVVYPASKEFQNRKSIVRLKCAEGKKDTATFKIVDEDNWKFELTHSWDPCPTKLTPDPESSTSGGVIAGSTVGAVAGVSAFIGLIYVAVRYRNKNNDAGERGPILRDAAADVFHNPIGQSNPANPFRPLPFGSSHAKADLNVIGSVSA